ncbi:ATP-binding protein [Rhizobium leguminosarum]|uniref:histidine kinase n=1 Tax=Rhizobium leguminosarum TaxID=384 RepID=A0A6P0BEG8_RHILE|nr:ATP-binding protein [Rhizobium leguminosarum]MBY5440692.1 response regulator [Rhizobium leguminosarum]NEI36362.1 response regulator [Rhizobium leguminosarum]NEI42629.1 response regulator [Rhizobium leguminosarum]
MDLLSATDWLRHRPGCTYPLAIAFVGLTFLLRLAASDTLSEFPFLSFLPAILLASFIGGAGPGLVAALVAGFIVQQFFVEPHNVFWPVSAGQWVGLSTYFINAAIIVGLMEMIIIAHERQSRLRSELNSFNTRLEETVVQRTAELRHEMEENAAVQAQVRQLQKMETIGQLTGGVAHDFNNMLAIIIGNLDLAQRRLSGSEDPRLPYSIQNAKDGAQRAAVLTARLLAFSRQQPLAPEVIDLNKLVGGMSELLRRTLGEQIRIETVLAGGLWPSFADLSQLENAILNLAVNARDAMPGGGNLTIETANTELDERYSRMHSEVEAGQYVMVSITDTGTGMSPEVIERAFDPFYTTKGPGKGTGLGLSQVYGYVKQSGGHIKIYSEIDRGTTVKIYLPRRVGVTDARSGAVGAQPIPHGSLNDTILVVEDDEHVRTMTAESLHELGYTVLQAASGIEALLLLEENPAVDLIFTDIVMPQMSGRQLADVVQEKWPTIRILYTTGYTRNAIVHNGVLDHGVSLLAKPFSLEQLAHKIRELLNVPARAGDERT